MPYDANGNWYAQPPPSTASPGAPQGSGPLGLNREDRSVGGDIWNSAKKLGGAANSAGDSILDLAAGGSRTDVNRYDQWDEAQMQSNRNAQEASRAQQMWLGEQYKNQIAGNGPSVAENQMRAGNEQAMQNQMSMARSGRGPLGQGNAQYNAQVNMANQSQQVNRDAATLRAQEQLSAMQNYGQLSGQQRGQDIDMFGGEAGYQNMKAESYNAWSKAQAEAAEAYKQRRGSGVAGLMSAAGGAASIVGF